VIKNLLQNEKTIIYILLISFLIKVLLLVSFTQFDFPDGRAYMRGAKLLFENNFIWPNNINNEAPLTYYYYALAYKLGLIYGIKGFAFFNTILATFTVYIIYKISELVFSRKEAIIAAFIVMVYPYFNFYAIHPFSETFFISILYIAFLFALKFIVDGKSRNIYLFAFFFAFSVLSKFSGLPMFFIILLLLGYISMKRFGFSFAIKSILISLVIFLSIMSIWWIRNYKVYGYFVATSIGESGKVFYTGNNPMNKSGGGIGGIDVDLTQFNNIKDFAKRDEALKKAALKWIKENPTDWIKLEFQKLKRFYSIFIVTSYFNNWYYQFLSVISYGVILILFVFSLYFNREKLILISPMLIYMFLLTAVHLVYIASLRYRLPLEPFMIIMASSIIGKIFRKYNGN